MADGLARITIVGTSHIRRLSAAMEDISWPQLAPDFDVAQAEITFICQGGWTLRDVRGAQHAIDASRPDFLIVQAGSNDMCKVSYIDSIKVANDLIEITKSLCSSSGAKGALLCNLTQRNTSRYLPTTADAEAYNARIFRANLFLKEVLGAGLEPMLFSWPHKGMVQSMAHLLGPDGTHMNDRGQWLFYKSLRGAVIQAAHHAGCPRPSAPGQDSDHVAAVDC